MGVLADGMGGKSGGRKAADQVILTAQQLFERYAPTRDDPTEALKQLVLEAHLMIKLTAITCAPPAQSDGRVTTWSPFTPGGHLR